MAKEASEEELLELEAILRANPELHFSLQAIEDIWLHTLSHNTFELDAAYQNHLARMKDLGIDPPATTFIESKRPRRTIPAMLVIASVIGIVALLFYQSRPSAPLVPVAHVANATPSEISTRYGSKTNIVLPDGTKVWLNAGSKLTYDKSFGESYRNVVLTGEAYFDVTRDAEMPFVIHTRDVDIKVLGTEFNVKSYPDEHSTETSLIRGSIEVIFRNRDTDKIILKPNEKLVVMEETQPILHTTALQKTKQAEPLFSVSHLNYFSRDSTILETSWVENRLVFEDESFGDLAAKMARWYGVSFDFQDKQLENLRFTGSFRNESVEEALTAMKITADFSFMITNKTITITK